MGKTPITIEKLLKQTSLKCFAFPLTRSNELKSETVLFNFASIWFTLLANVGYTHRTNFLDPNHFKEML